METWPTKHTYAVLDRRNEIISLGAQKKIAAKTKRLKKKYGRDAVYSGRCIAGPRTLHFVFGWPTKSHNASLIARKTAKPKKNAQA